MTTETYDVTNAAKPTIVKDPNAVLDYTWNWTTWLLDAATPTDTIATATAAIVSPADGLVIGPAPSGPNVIITLANKAVTVWLSGGTSGKKTAVTVSIISAAGRKDDRTFYFKIKER